MGLAVYAELVDGAVEFDLFEVDAVEVGDGFLDKVACVFVGAVVAFESLREVGDLVADGGGDFVEVVEVVEGVAGMDAGEAGAAVAGIGGVEEKVEEWSKINVFSVAGEGFCGGDLDGCAELRVGTDQLSSSLRQLGV